MNGFFGGMFGGASGPKMCLNCRTKPAFQNHDYCGKTCAEWAKKNPPAPAAPSWGQAPPPGGPAPGWGYGNYGPPAGPPPQQQGQWSGYGQYPQGPQQAPGQMMCQNCHTKPVFPGHQYCSKTCGANAKKGAGPPPMPPQQHGPPAGYGGYGPPPQQQGQWPQGPPPAWGPNPQQGGQWQGPPQGGQPWGPPQQGWNQGGPPRRRGRRAGGYDDDDGDDWPDDEEDDDEWEEERPRSKRTSLAKKGTKMCMNCFQHPSVGKAEFCSKKCKLEASAKLGNKGSGGARRATGGRRRPSGYDDVD